MVMQVAKKTKPRWDSRFVAGIEHPQTVMLVPTVMGSPDANGGEPDVAWWSHENSPQLVGGIEVVHVKNYRGPVQSYVGYLPIAIPRSWTGKEFGVVLEYESEHKNSVHDFVLYYGCGDPSDLKVEQTETFKGKTLVRERIKFPLRSHGLDTNELFRCSVCIRRASPFPILLYGAWLEIGVED